MFMMGSVTYYIGLHVGAKQPVFHLSPCDGHVIFVSGCLILTAVNSSSCGLLNIQWVYERAGVRNVITKFSCVHRFPFSLINGTPPRAINQLKTFFLMLFNIVLFVIFMTIIPDVGTILGKTQSKEGGALGQY